jgi:hypothetical protein
MDIFAVYTGDKGEPRAWSYVGNSKEHTAADLDRSYWCAVARLVVKTNEDIDRAVAEHGSIAAAYDAHFKTHSRGPYFGSLSVRRLTVEEFEKEQIAFYEALPVEEIKEDRFYELLYALPPLHWHGNGGSFESFCLAESTNGVMTKQVMRARIDGADRYFTADRAIKNIFTLSTLLERLA